MVAVLAIFSDLLACGFWVVLFILVGDDEYLTGNHHSHHTAPYVLVLGLFEAAFQPPSTSSSSFPRTAPSSYEADMLKGRPREASPECFCLSLTVV